MNAQREKAYAKINLYLDVTAKRDDGFHDIVTVMHSVSLADDITVTVNSLGNRSVRLVLEGNRKLPTDSKNLALMAAELFLERAGIEADVTVKLNKRIPVSAGLAGGSTDAAAVLRAMNKLFRRPLADRALLSLAEHLGSDVPYCLIGGTVLCEGRGEVMTRLADKLHLFTVVAVAREHVSTPVAYSRLDSIYSDFTVERQKNTSLDEIMKAIDTGAKPEGGLYNIFEDAVFPICPGARDIKERMLTLGATHSAMSGSGPSVFGIFENEASARTAAAELNSLGFSAFYAESI